MSRNWTDMKREEFEPPVKAYNPVDLRAVEDDLGEILFDHVADYWEPIRLGGSTWEFADHEAYIHRGKDCDRFCDGELILRRKADGLLVAFEISVSAWRFKERADDSSRA